MRLRAISEFQTVKARKSLQSLKALSTPHTKVIREGKKHALSQSELTVGDIVLIEAGDVISADARLLQAYSLQVNESSLTGEAVSVDKSVDAILSDNCALGDQTNMVFSSGTCDIWSRCRRCDKCWNGN